jgi:hypothetical protein
MATGPTFTPSDASPASHGDALERVHNIDREIRRLTAQKSEALMLARQEEIGGVVPGYRMLANRSFRAQVAVLLNITEKAAENLIGYSSVLTKAFPKTLEALKVGEISWQHATVIVDELGALEDRSRGIIENTALTKAPAMTAHKLARVVRLARESLNPETIPERHAAARQLRGVSVEDGSDGMSTLFYTNDSVHVHAIFNKLTAGARAMNGPLETRTLNQRRADIFDHVMLAEVDGEHFGIIPDDWDDENFVKWFRGIKAEVIVSVPVLTLLGHSEEPATLDGWVPIDPDIARVLAGSAKSFVRILTHPETGAVLSVGRRRYKVPKDLKLYLQIRDVTCRFPGCIQPAQLSDMDHSLDWQFGGETRASNLASLCPGHHTLKGDTEWTVVQDADGSGTLTWTDPSGRTYRTFPENPIAA